MKNFITGILAIVLMTVAACTNSSNPSKESDVSKMNTDSSQKMTNDTLKVKEITPSFTDVDKTLAASLKSIFDHYLHIKNALVDDKGSEAASGGKAMAEVMNKLDRSLFTAEQKKVYDNIEDDLKEHAEHISTNADKIEHQREHFALMSEDVYDLAKAFGAGRILYHDHCPMYNETKGGSFWLSETPDIRNPFMGSKMPACGKVEEKIKD